MVSVLIVGYRNFDLGIFNDKDPRIKIIKKAIQRDLTRLLEEGAEWLIFTGNLGFEVWALEVAKELQKDYNTFIKPTSNIVLPITKNTKKSQNPSKSREFCYHQPNGSQCYSSQEKMCNSYNDQTKK